MNPSPLPGEGEIAAFVAGWARAAGLDARVLEEWVSVADTEAVARSLARAAATLCG